MAAAATWDVGTTTWVVAAETWVAATWAAWTAGETTCAAWPTTWTVATWATAAAPVAMPVVAAMSPWAKLLAAAPPAVMARVPKAHKRTDLRTAQHMVKH